MLSDVPEVAHLSRWGMFSSVVNIRWCEFEHECNYKAASREVVKFSNQNGPT